MINGCRVGSLAAALLGVGMWSITAAAETLRIAAASNLQVVMEPLSAAFASEHPQHELSASHAATGSLVAQIRHGAPFDVLLAADLDYPRALIKSGHAVGESLQPFAHGILMLWPHPAHDDWINALRSPQVRRIAIAQPETAPYGKAARALLMQAGIWDDVESRVVWGENVAQALHFAHSGNADFGLVPASLLIADTELGDGLPLPLDPAALPHGAVLLTTCRNPALARIFLHWLQQAPAQEILRNHGYRVP